MLKPGRAAVTIADPKTKQRGASNGVRSAVVTVPSPAATEPAAMRGSQAATQPGSSRARRGVSGRHLFRIQPPQPVASLHSQQQGQVLVAMSPSSELGLPARHQLIVLRLTDHVGFPN